MGKENYMIFVLGNQTYLELSQFLLVIISKNYFETVITIELQILTLFFPGLFARLSIAFHLSRNERFSCRTKLCIYNMRNFNRFSSLPQEWVSPNILHVTTADK